MADGFVPPAEVRANAKRGLELRKKHGRGGTAIGVARARDLSNGSAISLSTIKRMVSYFARHEVDKKGEGWGKDSAGYIAWLLWGGDAGRSWANKIARESEKKDKGMSNDFATSYAEIIKADKQEDGSLLVYGKATDDSLDIDQQICDAVWLSKAMPEWFRTGGNIREQHSNIAAGVAKEYEEKSDGHYIRALVVDPVSVKIVENGVLKGFSIGIKAPRILRDTKAANGRIVDGQIVEVSLVDRPANPNAKLVLAKSVDGASSLIKVEELEEQVKSNEGSTMKKSALAESILELAKSATGETVKFDQASYDTARRAIANLIIVEAGEMADGDDERDDIEELMDALKHLFRFYESESEAGETAPVADLALAAASDKMKESHKDAGCAGCDCDGCDSCDGCEDKYCKLCKCGMAATADKSVNKCLECGCHKPADSHGASVVADSAGNADTRTNVANVSTAQIVTPEQGAGSIKSAEGDAPAETPAEAPADAAVEAPAEETKEILDESAVAEIVEEAVKSATEKVKAEIASMADAAVKAAESKVVALESELTAAKSKAAAGGPKRTRTVTDSTPNQLLIKAAEFRSKAAATTDPILSKGYKALEAEYLKKAGKSVDEDLD